MAAEYPSKKKQKQMANDMMKYRSTNSTIGKGPLTAMTAAQIAASPMRQVSGNTVNTTPMPTVLPKPISIERSPEELMARDLANETSSAMKGANYNETPAAPLRDRAMAIPTGKEQSMNMRATPKQTGPREYATFGEFLKTMGLGK